MRLAYVNGHSIYEDLKKDLEIILKIISPLPIYRVDMQRLELTI